MSLRGVLRLDGSTAKSQECHRFAQATGQNNGRTEVCFFLRRTVYFLRFSVYIETMTQIKVLLPELLARRRINRRQLSELTGLRYATLSDVYHGQSRPSLETLELVMQGLERLTGQPVELSDLLEIIRPPDPTKDPIRPALDPAALKPFTLRPRGPAPQTLVPTETLVAQIRGRD